MSEQTLNDRIESATAQAKEAVQKLQDRAVELKGQLQETATSKLEPLRESTEKAAQEQSEKLKQAAQEQSEKLKQAADKLLTQLEIEARLGAILNRLGMPTSNDLKALDKKLNSLTRKVRKLEKASA